MSFSSRYAHTNLIARDWRALADFYERVFGCVPVPPVRHLEGDALARGTAIPGARLDGVHLRLPGFGDSGPTLEIFTYGVNADRPATVANRPGFGHICFRVSDLPAACQAIIDARGAWHGELVTTPAGSGAITWVYMKDPEGNLIELQG